MGASDKYLLIANSCEHTVIAYDHSGNYQKYLVSGATFRMPTVITSLESGMIYVKDDTQIHVFDPDANFVKVFGKEFFKRMPVGLLCISDEFYVIDSDVDLVKFSANGKYISRRELQWKGMKKPRIRYANSHGATLYLSDMANAQVHLATTDGAILRSVGHGFGLKVGQFAQPAGVSIDAHGAFLIADSKNHRIQAFDPKGQAMCVLNLLSPKAKQTNKPTTSRLLNRPSDVALTDDGILFVSALDGNAYVFKLS